MDFGLESPGFYKNVLLKVARSVLKVKTSISIILHFGIRIRCKLNGRDTEEHDEKKCRNFVPKRKSRPKFDSNLFFQRFQSTSPFC